MTNAKRMLGGVEDFVESVRYLYNEIDCRIEHGAESGGHLEYVRNQLHHLLGYDPRTSKDS